MKGFSFPPPPPPPPPPRATPQDGNSGANAQYGGQGFRSARGGADRGRGRGRGRGPNSRGSPSPRNPQHAPMTTSFQAQNQRSGHALPPNPLQHQPFLSNGSLVNHNPLPTGSYINPAFASAYTNYVNSDPVVSSWNPATAQQQTSFPPNTNAIASNPVNDSLGLHQPSSRPQSIQKPKSASKPKVAAPPAVPSFAFQLPTATADERISNNNKKRKFNKLGLTPRSDVHEGSEEEDVDEEAKFSSGVLQFEYKGHSSTLKTSADIAAWIAERKKRWPTRARILEKQKADDELRKTREEKRQIAEANSGKDNRQKAKEAPAYKRKRESEDRNNMEKHLAKAEKLRKKLERAEAKLTGGAPMTSESKLPGSSGEVATDANSKSPEPQVKFKANLVGYDSDDDEQDSDVESSVISSDSSDSSSNTDSTSSADEDSDSNAPPEEESSVKRPVKVAPPARKAARDSMPKKSNKKEAKRLTLRERMIEQEQQQEAEMALEAIKFLGDQGLLGY